MASSIVVTLCPGLNIRPMGASLVTIQRGLAQSGGGHVVPIEIGASELTLDLSSQAAGLPVGLDALLFGGRPSHLRIEHPILGTLGGPS